MMEENPKSFCNVYSKYLVFIFKLIDAEFINSLLNFYGNISQASSGEFPKLKLSVNAWHPCFKFKKNIWKPAIFFGVACFYRNLFFELKYGGEKKKKEKNEKEIIRESV